MKAALKRLVSSPTTTIVLLLVYGAGLAAATFIEKYQGVRLPGRWCIVLLCFSFFSFCWWSTGWLSLSDNIH